MSLACKPIFASPISPSISAFGVSAATESITMMSIAPERMRLSVISRACSPLSGCDMSSESTFTPRFFAYVRSKACSASIIAAMPPCFCASAMACMASVVLPDDSGPKISITLPRGYPPIPQYEDYGLWVRMLMNGCRFYNLQESLLYFRTMPDTFRRRGGWKYVVKEIGLQKEMYRIGFISAPTFCLNVLIRLVVRLMPNGIRGFIYKSLLRKKK